MFSSLPAFLASSLSLFVSTGAFAQDPFQAPPRPAPLAIEYDFRSIGEGIDGATLEVVRNVAFEFFTTGKAVKLTQVQLGREGEIKICIEGKVFQTAREIEALVALNIQPKETVSTKILLKCR